MRGLLFRSIKKLAGNSIPVETAAPESAHIGLTQSLGKPHEFVFCLVNVTSGPVRPLRNVLIVYNLTTKLNLKDRLISFKILRTNGAAQVNYANNWIEVKLDKLDDFFAVHLIINL